MKKVIICLVLAMMSVAGYAQSFVAKMEQTDIMIVAALKAIFEQADAKGKPCVVNLSNGSRKLWEQTRSLAEQAIENMLKVPGHIFVAAAGNEGCQDVYREKKAGETMDMDLGPHAARLYVSWKKSEGPRTQRQREGHHRHEAAHRFG